ncbi:FAD-dependent oxidoreductase [Streptomyces sp. NPDC051940]|uniref:NAD(P)/FAD-dependent oxidoreductase n=1 Tax=Streptomyces sp. NPDC051940 TaxID=3155675 RepID=UPI0034177DD2
MTGRRIRTPDVAIVGAGPAGLAAAARLAPHVGSVLVLERERAAGGIPRHSDHTGFGIRDLRRVMRGPAYARTLAERAVDAGAQLLTEATVTGWCGERSLEVTTPQGLLRVDARAVILATGARERPRSARLIPGDRPSGVFTTGQLQNLVHLHGGSPGRRAVVVGAEPVSWLAVLTLRESGCRPVLMTTCHPVPESYRAARHLLRVPVATRTRLVRVIGRRRLEAVELEHTDTGSRRTVACDTLVLTGDWIPDHELARAAGLAMDPGTRGPLTDTALRTSTDGIFAAGNLLHPADTADVAALDGRHAAASTLRYLAAPAVPRPPLALEADTPFRWVTPGLFRPGDPPPPRARLLLWSDALVRTPRVTVHQDSRLLTARPLPWPATPGRVFRVPWRLLAGVDPGGGAVRIGLGPARLG